MASETIGNENHKCVEMSDPLLNKFILSHFERYRYIGGNIGVIPRLIAIHHHLELLSYILHMCFKWFVIKMNVPELTVYKIISVIGLEIIPVSDVDENRNSYG